MTYRRAKSQSKKETRHKYISFIREPAKLKYVLLFFCRNQKLKASNEKRSGTIRETLSLKLQGCWGEAKLPLPQKTKKCVLWHIVTKNERSAISKEPKSTSQNTPFCTFSKGTQNYTNHIALIICALQTFFLRFCVFAFLCFCIFVFWILTAKWGATEKDCPQGGKAKRGVQ